MFIVSGYEEYEKLGLVNKLIILKVLDDHRKNNIPMSNERFHYLLLLLQMQGVPISYIFKQIPEGVLIAESDNHLVKLKEFSP